MNAIRSSLFILFACLIAVAAWSVGEPDSASADEIPKEFHETIAKGLEFLAKNQFDDGHWEGDEGKRPVATTALAGIALLMESDRSQDRRLGIRRVDGAKYLSNVRKGADWLRAKSSRNRDGLIFSDHPSETSCYMEGHGFATIFLAGVALCEGDER